MKTRRQQQQRRSVQLPMSSEIVTEYRYLANGTEGRYEGLGVRVVQQLKVWKNEILNLKK